MNRLTMEQVKQALADGKLELYTASMGWVKVQPAKCSSIYIPPEYLQVTYDLRHGGQTASTIGPEDILHEQDSMRIAP